MQDIYLLVGQIVEVSQVIEYNLAILIKYSEYISKIKGKHKLTNDDYGNFYSEVEQTYLELNTSTLGQIINKVKEIDIFSQQSIDKLYNLLNERNYLVHSFFKENNFIEIVQNTNRYNEIKCKLEGTYASMQEINNRLCEIIKGMQIEFSNL